MLGLRHFFQGIVLSCLTNYNFSDPISDDDPIKPLHFTVDEERFLNKQRALHLAARNGHKRIVRLLLDCGANIASRAWFQHEPKTCDNKGVNKIYNPNALHLAAQYGHENMVHLLLQRGTKSFSVLDFPACRCEMG